MNKVLKTICVVLLSMGLANCGSDDGGGGAPAPADNGLANGVTKLDYTNGVDSLSYISGNTTDFYITLSNGSKKCLADSADDQTVSDVYAQIMALLNSSAIGKGSRDTIGSNPRYLTVTYSDGKQRTFNLNNESATVNQEVLSNGQDIIDYLDSIHNQIDSSSNGNCRVGK